MHVHDARWSPLSLGCHNRGHDCRSVRARGDLARLSHRAVGVREFSLAAGRVLRRVMPFDGVCVMTMDPATLLPTGHVIENGLPEEATPQLAGIELQGADFNRLPSSHAAARRPRPSARRPAASSGAAGGSASCGARTASRTSFASR